MSVTTYSRPSGSLSRAELVEEISGYISFCGREYEILHDIDTEDVVIEVSARMKRAAGKAVYSPVTEDCTIRIALGAYEAWGWNSEFEGVIRHELAHIIEYKRFGEGGHGARFRMYADALDAPRSCSQFTEYAYRILCSECDTFVAGRHKRCGLTKNPSRYRSKCCGSSLRVTRT